VPTNQIKSPGIGRGFFVDTEKIDMPMSAVSQPETGIFLPFAMLD
jgi:hypothetical protein